MKKLREKTKRKKTLADLKRLKNSYKVEPKAI